MALVDRWYDILNILEANPNMTQQELEHNLGTSRQTLKKNIKLLNKELENIAVITLDNQKYSLSILQFDEYEKILSGKLKRESDFNSSSKRIAYILKSLIETNKPIIIDDLSEELTVSRGTVSNDLKSIRKVIQPYDVEIIGITNQGLKIVGSELNIRLIYINIVLEYYLLEHIDETTKQNILVKCRELNVRKQSINLLLRVIESTFMRIKLGKHLNSPIDYYENFISNTDVFEHLITYLEEEYGITLSRFEGDFICYPLNIYNQDNESGKEYQFVKTKQIFDQMMRKIQELFVIEFDKNQLFEDIKVHLAHLINRLVMNVQTNDLFLNELQAKYPLSYAMGKVAAQVITNIINRPVPDVEVSYLTLYIEMAISRSNESSSKDIAVICHTGRGTAAMIKSQLQRVLGNNVNVTAYSQSEVTDELLSKYFAIFTTIPLRRDTLTTPIVQLSTIFDDNYIREQWEIVERTQSINSDHVEAVITKLDHNQTYETNLRKMTKELREKMLTDSEFGERIIEREELKSTVFDKGVAVPHAVNKHGNKLVLSVGQFDKPFKSETSMVEVVFMIGIPESAPAIIENVLLDVYDFFFVVANNPKMKQIILEAESATEIKELIQREVI